MNYEDQYLQMCRDILDYGEYAEDRTGTGTYSITGYTYEHDLSKGFPLLTTKKMNLNLIAGEALWFLAGLTDLKSLRRYQNKPEGSRTIWTDDFEKFWDNLDKFYGLGKDPLCHRQNECGGRIYGKQWRRKLSLDYDGRLIHHDQIETLIKNIIDVKNGNPRQARRLIVNSWDPYDHTEGEKVVSALSACHDSFQCIVRGGKLDLRFQCRSNDTLLGNPYNTGSYALICHILANITGLRVGKLVYFGTDVHIYSNHIEQVEEQLSRKPKKAPEIIMPNFDTLEDVLELTGKDFKLEGYDPYSAIKALQAS